MYSRFAYKHTVAYVQDTWTVYLLFNLQDVDIGLAAITVTEERSQQVDFTINYMDLGK